MAKITKPLLSLSAHGTLGNAITYARHPSAVIAKTKPVPTDRRTLLQQYQRWLYQDAAYYWLTLSTAQKAVYRAAGAREHRCAYAAFMSYYLSNLPDIAAIWHLDYIAATTTPDSSRNTNTGTVYGSIPVPGRIDHALTFDGVDDHVIVPYHSSLDFTDAFTLEAFIKPTTIPFPADLAILTKGAWGSRDYFLYSRNGDDELRVNIHTTAMKQATTVGADIKAGVWTHIAVTYDRVALKIFVDAVEKASTPETGAMTMTENTLAIGEALTIMRWDGNLDHVVLWNRALALPQITLHSRRGYP